MIRNILIIEDEKLSADRIIRLMHSISPETIIGPVIESVEDAIVWLTTQPHPDVILMDIRLSDGLSFEIFSRTKIQCPVIFTTAYDEYAVRAFKFNSIDYLLKPIDQIELASALEKLQVAALPLSVSALEGLKNFLLPKEYRSRFLLPFRDGYKTILTQDILYLYSEFKVTWVQMVNGSKEPVPQTLEELEKELNPKHFFRANRQFIIQIDAIEKIYNHFSGKIKVYIKNNPEIEVLISRNRVTDFKRWLNF